MEYTIARILKEAPVEGKFGPQIRTAFTTNETGEDVLSSFTKYPVKVGQKIDGTVTVSEKDGKTYHNFVSAPRNTSIPGGNENIMIELKKIFAETYNARQEIVMVRQLLQEGNIIPIEKDALGLKHMATAEMVASDAKDPLDDFDEINPADIPF